MRKVSLDKKRGGGDRARGGFSGRGRVVGGGRAGRYIHRFTILWREEEGSLVTYYAKGRTKTCKTNTFSGFRFHLQAGFSCRCSTGADAGGASAARSSRKSSFPLLQLETLLTASYRGGQGRSGGARVSEKSGGGKNGRMDGPGDSA